MRILGISAFHRDAAAALLIDGQPVAAAREEHFSRQPRDSGFPSRAIGFCLGEAGIEARDIDRVVFYEKPLRKFERLLVCQLRAFPRSARGFAHGAFAWLGDRLWVKNRIAKELGVDFDVVLFTEHQEALLANAFYQSPFATAALLSIDDVGEWATAGLGVGGPQGIQLTREMRLPHSLGFVASAMTQFLGLRPGHDEHLLEALAHRGEPRMVDAFRALIPEADGWFTVDGEAFRFTFDADQLFGDGLIDRLGPPRFSGDPLRLAPGDSHHADLACSLQVVLQERALTLCERAREIADEKYLCLAGELAANRALVAHLRQHAPFEAIFVPDPATKSGGALGAALRVHHALHPDAERAAFDLRLGEAIDDRQEPGGEPLTGSAVDALADELRAGGRVAWVRGRLEFGTHSSGNRVVLSRIAEDPTPQPLLSCLQRSEPFLPCRRATLDPGTSPGWCLQVDPVTDPELHALVTIVGDLWIADYALRDQPCVRTAADAVTAFERTTLTCLVVGDHVYRRRP